MARTIDRSRLCIPALAGLYNGLGKYMYPLLRFTCGAFLVPHGWAKVIGGSVARYNEAGALVGGTAGFMAKMGFPAPEALAWYIALLELVGGAMMAIGFLTRVVAAQVIGFMFVAAFVVNADKWFWNGPGMEFPVFWMIVAFIVLIRGGGDLSVDCRLSKEF